MEHTRKVYATPKISIQMLFKIWPFIVPYYPRSTGPGAQGIQEALLSQKPKRWEEAWERRLHSLLFQDCYLTPALSCSAKLNHLKKRFTMETPIIFIVTATVVSL